MCTWQGAQARAGPHGKDSHTSTQIRPHPHCPCGALLVSKECWEKGLRTARWPEALPMKTTIAATHADLISWCVSLYRIPEAGPHTWGLTVEVWAALWSRLGISHQLTMAYQPQAWWKDFNGGWRMSHLTWALIGLRTDLEEDSLIPSAKQLFAKDRYFGPLPSGLPKC